jgi:hypothetical protein
MTGHSGTDAALKRYTESQWARVLTQMDRDPESPTFGSFDRNHWHYKIRDFASSILQQGVFTIEAARTGVIATEAEPETLERWAIGAVNALSRQTDATGGVNEYYPYERSYPASAFGLMAVARVLFDWQTSAPHLLENVNWPGLRRLARLLGKRVEAQASNQQAAGLAGLALASRIDEMKIDQASVIRIADQFLPTQHAEGWFDEYGGPDFGYLAVTLDAMADYHDATGDDRALDASDRAVAFLARVIGADGRLPTTCNSRNTDYVVPYGLARTGARNATAAWLVDTLFGQVDDPEHFLWATDDRYHSHYIFASVVRSLPWISGMVDAETPDLPSTDWLPGCGYFIHRSEGGEWSACVAAKKGGLVRIHRRDDFPIVDHGWRIQGKKFWTSNWWSDDWEIEHDGGTVRIGGPCQVVSHEIGSPSKHVGLRAAAKLLGSRLIPLLKQFIIFRAGKQTGPRFDRTVEVNSSGVRIIDRFEATKGSTATTSPRQNIRHVASADSFNREELRPPLIGWQTLSMESANEVVSSWTADEAG